MARRPPRAVPPRAPHTTILKLLYWDGHWDCYDCGCAFFVFSCLVLLYHLSLLLLPSVVFTPEPLIRAASARRHAAPAHKELAAALHPNASTSVLGRAQPASMLYRDIESSPGLFERLAKQRAENGELIFLTSDRDALAMTLNLIASLHELGIGGRHLLLARDKETCNVLSRRGRVACMWSSYLINRASTRRINVVEVMWLQRHHYVGRAIAAGLNLLLLDSDVLLSRNPYPYLKSPPLSEYEAVVQSDSTGGASPLHLNGGVWYIQNAHADGPLRALFLRFDEHVRNKLATGNGTSFDQAIINQQASTLLPLSPMMALYRLGQSGFRLSQAYAEVMLDIMPMLLWKWSCCHATPNELPSPGGSYGRSYGIRWIELPKQPEWRTGGHAKAERLAKAPPWLFSAESDLAPPPWRIHAGAVRVDSRGWGANPPPFVLSHFVCSAWPGSEGRVQAMRLWGQWRLKAIGRELPRLYSDARALRSVMVGLARPVAQSRAGSRNGKLNEAGAFARLVLALGMATGRTPVLPALRCEEDQLTRRCVWQAAGSDHLNSNGRRGGHVGGLPHGPTCVLRWPSGCGNALLLPSEAHEASGGSIKRLTPRNASELVSMLRVERNKLLGTERRYDSLSEARRVAASASANTQQAPKLLLIDLGPRQILRSEQDVDYWRAHLEQLLSPMPNSLSQRERIRHCGLLRTPAPRCQAVC